MRPTFPLMFIIYRLAVNTIGLGVAVALFRHVSVAGFGTLVIAAVILSIFNFFVKPVLTFISIPFLVLTLGLFYIIISGLVVMLVAWVVPGFYVDGLWAAIGVAAMVGIINFVFDIIAAQPVTREG